MSNAGLADGQPIPKEDEAVMLSTVAGGFADVEAAVELVQSAALSRHARERTYK